MLDRKKLDEAVERIGDCHGFDDETSSVGEAWSVVLTALSAYQRVADAAYGERMYDNHPRYLNEAMRDAGYEV